MPSVRYNTGMNKSLKLIPVGNSTGVILPREMLAELGLRQGDSVAVVRTPAGYELRAGSEDFQEQMAAARAVMQRRRAALRELAK